MLVVTKDEAKIEIKKLVDSFASKSDQELKDMNESTVNKNFILPLFHALGWAVYSDEVSAEEKVSKKRVDFGFKINGMTKFFLEAKRPSEDVLGDIEHIKQAINYSYWQSVTWAILTNFRDLVVFNAEWKGRNLSENRFITLNFKEFIDKFDELWLVSRECLEKNIIDEKAVTLGKKQKREPIGEQILSDMITWRELLTKNINKYDHKLDEETLDEAVQRILDRLIFIKSCEDRNIESPALLAKTRQWEENWMHAKRTLREELILIFRHFDEKYNSKLFEPHICEELKIDDDILLKIITQLNGDEAGLVKYDFSAIPADILGNIYEQYLGHILKKSKKTAKVVEKHSHRKEQGIYYTPTYIVDYIVQNTVGESTKNKSIDEILETKILDPACGSGSFLIKAYTTLLKIIEDKMKKGETSKKWQSFKSYSGRLALNQKISILTSCIHGVDLDKKAVEISQLNLLLKLLESETGETLANIKEIKKLLPMLNSNIKCGNSLIDDEKIVGDKAFVWEEQFKDIISRGGFDVVIGNPPYVDIKQLDSIIVKYLFRKYATVENRMNLYSVFVEKSLHLIKVNGFFSFIIPNSILYNESYTKIREAILDTTTIKKIVRLPDNVFQDVKVETIIFVYQKNKEKINEECEVLIYPRDKEISFIEKYNCNQVLKIDQNEWNSQNKIFTISSTDNFSSLLAKIENNRKKLIDLCEFCLGVTPYDKYKGHTKKQIEERSFHSATKKDGTYKPLLSGENIIRYGIFWDGKEYISYGKWLGAPREQKFFIKPRIVVRQIISGNPPRIYAGYTEEELYNTQIGFNLIVRDEHTVLTKYILAIINSKLMNFYHKEKFLDPSKRLFQKILIVNAKNFPIGVAKIDQQKKICELVNEIINLNKRLFLIGERNTEEKLKIEEKINQIDDQIDNEIFDLYKINDNERKTIESSMK